MWGEGAESGWAGLWRGRHFYVYAWPRHQRVRVAGGGERPGALWFPAKEDQSQEWDDLTNWHGQMQGHRRGLTPVKTTPGATTRPHVCCA